MLQHYALTTTTQSELFFKENQCAEFHQNNSLSHPHGPKHAQPCLKQRVAS